MVRRGEIRWFRFDRPDKRRPVLVLTRDDMIAVLGDLVVAPITSAIRGGRSELRLDTADGMPRVCAINFYQVKLVKRGDLGAFIAKLPDDRWPDVRRALLFALGFEP